MKVKIEPVGPTKCFIVTLCIGQKYLDIWERNCQRLWTLYCQRNGFGLVVFDAELDHNASENILYKKATWQKYLIPDQLKRSGLAYDKILFLDADILINPYAPNIFSMCPAGRIGVVSKRNLPYPYEQVLRRIALYRSTYYSSEYPLDSSLFISLKNLYEYHQLTPQSDEFCAGLLLFDELTAPTISSVYQLYDRGVKSITNDGDQTHANYVIQSSGTSFFLDYSFQALWVYEMALFYPYLYPLVDKYSINSKAFYEAIYSCLSRHHFLHFAGSWFETQVWSVLDLSPSDEWLHLQERLFEYSKVKLSGKPVGLIRPD